MEPSSQTILFTKVVEAGSFSAAARAVGHSPSAVSRQIGHLEDRLGVRLLHRSKQGLSLGGNFEANSADGVDHATRAGLGIARLSTCLVSDDSQAGRLVRLLPDCSDEGADIFAVYSEKRNLAPKVRAFIDFLVGCFGTVPPWERQQEDGSQDAT